MTNKPAARRPSRPAFDPLAAAMASVSSAMTENADRKGAPPSVKFDDQECQITFSVQALRFKVSDNPKRKGQVCFVAELEAVESDHPRCTPGKRTSWVRFSANEINEREIGSFLRAVTDTPELSDEALRTLLIDDAAALRGCHLRVEMVAKHSDKHDRTFYNPYWSHVSLTDDAAAALADVLAAELEDEG